MSDVWRRLRLVMLACVAGSVAHAAQARVGEIINPGFELDEDRDGVPDGWTQPGGQASLDGEVKKRGNCSLRLRALPDARRINPVSQVVRVEPGALYRVSAWVRTEAYVPSTVVLRASLAARSGDSKKLLEFGQGGRGTTDWVQQPVDFLAPGDGEVMISCFFASWSPAVGTVWFDEVRLVCLAPPGGLARLPEPPRSCYALAEWAMLQKPPNWASLAAALDIYYRTAGRRRRTDRIRECFEALHAAARDDPEARAHLARVYGAHGWQLPLSAFLTDGVRPLCEAAVELAASDPTGEAAARQARLSLVRAIGLHTHNPLSDAARIRRLMSDIPEHERRRAVGLLLRDARQLAEANQLERATRVHDVVVAALDPGDPLRHKTELARLKLLVAAGDRRAARRAAEELAAPGRQAPDEVRKEALLALVKLGAAPEDIRLEKWAGTAHERLVRSAAELATLHLDHARALARARRWDKAAAACLTVVASAPQLIGICYEAQRLRVQALLEHGSRDEALAAAKVLYGAAPNSEEAIGEAVGLVVRALRTKHQAMAPAHAFVAFHRHGPQGRDGKAGTKDDLEDPLAKVVWRPPPEAEALFKETLAGLPEDFDGRRWRGYLHLYWGKPELALKELVGCYEAAVAERRGVEQAADDVAMALKARFGHTAIAQRFIAYRRLGPKGRDGKMATADDLRDPLKSLR